MLAGDYGSMLACSTLTVLLGNRSADAKRLSTNGHASTDCRMTSLCIPYPFKANSKRTTWWRVGATRNRLDTQWRYLGDITAAMFGALEYTTTIPIREQIRLRRLWFFYHDPRALTTSVSNKGSLRYKRRDMHEHLLASISKATITQGSLQVLWSTIAT